MRTLRLDAVQSLAVAVAGVLVACSSSARDRTEPASATAAAPAAPAAPAAAPGPGWRVPSDDTIRALLVERMQHNGVGVVVGVIDRAGRRVVAYGKRGAADDRPLDGNTVFQIGSATKPLTSLLLAEMVGRGEISLDDPAEKYLAPGATMPRRGRAITLRDLATHVSGLPPMPTNLDVRGTPDPYEAYSVADLHRFLATYQLPREPGAQWAYSNLAVSLLGRLLGNRAGTTYEALLRERVLAPLGMTDTGIALTAAQAARLAPGHDRYLRPVHTWEMREMPASGSLRSTANDLLKLLAAYLGYAAPPPGLAAAMQRQLAEPPPAADKGQSLGWRIDASGVFNHSGGKQGYRCGVAFDPKTGAGVVVLANARTEDRPIDIAMYLLTGRALEPAPRAPAQTPIAQLPAAELDRFAGRYRRASGEVVEIARHDDHLFVHIPGVAVETYFPTGPRDFFLDTGNDELSFEVDPRGRVTHALFYGDGKAGPAAPDRAPRL